MLFFCSDTVFGSTLYFAPYVISPPCSSTHLTVLVSHPKHNAEIGKVMHECESELVCKLSHPDSKIPYFNAGIYLENKKKIGKIDEIFGPLNLVMFTVKMDPGVVAKSFQEKDSVFIGTDKLLPLTRFTSPGGKYGIMFDLFRWFKR